LNATLDLFDTQTFDNAEIVDSGAISAGAAAAGPTVLTFGPNALVDLVGGALLGGDPGDSIVNSGLISATTGLAASRRSPSAPWSRR
jgi:hypothetical protein